MQAPTLLTERLVLRPFSEADIWPLAETVFSNPAVMATLPGEPQSPDEYAEYAENYVDLYLSSWADEEFGGWAVCCRDQSLGEQGTLLGFCGFEPGQIEGYGLELGFGYGEASWGRGIGSEAAVAARDWFLRQDRWDIFYACFVAGNIGSKRIIERIGMTFVGDMDLWDSVKNGHGLLPVYTFDRKSFEHSGC